MKKFRYFATVKDGKIVATSDSSNPREVMKNEIPLTENEIFIIRIVDGDMQFARNIIRDIEDRIAKKAEAE